MLLFFQKNIFKYLNLGDSDFENIFEKILIDNNISTFIPILNEELIIANKLRHKDNFKHIDFWTSDLYSQLVSKEEAYNLLKNIWSQCSRINFFIF